MISLYDYICANPGKYGSDIYKELNIPRHIFAQEVRKLIDQQLIYAISEGKDKYANPMKRYFSEKTIPFAKKVKLTDKVRPVSDTVGCVNGQILTGSMIGKCADT